MSHNCLIRLGVALILTEPVASLAQAHQGPVAVAHRGDSKHAPENTVSAISAANGKAQLVEFDVRECATGQLIVIHDETVDRTTNAKGEVAEMSFEQLRALDAGSWFSANFKGEQIPTLSEAIAAVPTDATALVEHKTGSAAQYVAELQKMGVQYEVVLQSFDWEFLTAVHRLDDKIRLGALGSGPLTSAEIIEMTAAGAKTVGWAAKDICTCSITRVHAASLALFVWTVNEPAEIERFTNLRVDGIISDNPAAVGR